MDEYTRRLIADAVDMVDFFCQQQEWSYETFGPADWKGPDGPLRHLEKEAKEAYDEKEPAAKREEIIDCLFLVFDAAHRAGMSYGDMAKEAMKKLEKNKAREWPDWFGTDPSQPIEHVR